MKWSDMHIKKVQSNKPEVTIVETCLLKGASLGSLSILLGHHLLGHHLNLPLRRGLEEDPGHSGVTTVPETAWDSSEKPNLKLLERRKSEPSA